uniref:Mannose/glucose-specific lectin-like n=1 Tax=Elaeis guineensis var. tenera TaxID=51953 RepID=A0A6J0PJ13_ELAGV|nr:mannose/glucose-specific lectin-like [Elaeis guineensis]
MPVYDSTNTQFPQTKELNETICSSHNLSMASRVDGANTLGPWGGSGGTAWSFENAQTITKIKISAGRAVDSITFQYMDGEIACWSPRYGGDGGTPTEIELGSAEFIISMKGYYSTHRGYTIIYSLTFVTTIREYGPYGREQGTQFSISKGVGWISGFHGRSGGLLDAIGVYKKTSFECGVVKVGPWGELKPQNLRDIESINFQYVADGVAKWSSNWGSESGSMAEIDLGNNHYLTAISGYYGNYHDCIVITSLTFVTTMSTYGPYGPNEGTAFSLPMRAGKIVGFFGYAGQWLDALGFYLKPGLVIPD